MIYVWVWTTFSAHTDICRSEYVCPKCGHFNPSFRALREARQKGGSSGRSSASPQRAPNLARTNGASPVDVTVLGSGRTERSRSRPREEGDDARGGKGQQEAAEGPMDIDS